ncbi:MAG TPA: PadR family transcriptional regulator [Propionibacteriaceae bacterium]|nr:PadR family transcriptional regulator [Propionibacteriaceae bacterium]
MHDFFTQDSRPRRGPRRGPEGRGFGRGSMGGGPFGPPMPFGPSGFGPRGPEGFGPRGPFGPGGPFGPRRARRGDVRTAILQLLAEQPMNGYQVIAALDERTEGAWKPSPGAVYPSLNQLEDEGLIEPFDNEGTKAYRLTSQGNQTAEVSPETPRPWESMRAAHEPSHPQGASQIWAAYGDLAHALKALTRSGTAAQHEAAAKAIAELQRSVYGILAEPAAPEASPEA